MRKKTLGIVLGIFIAAAVFFLIIQSVQWRRQATVPVSEQVLGRQNVVFTHPIFDPMSVRNITPVGELNGGYEEAQALAGVMVNLKSGAKEIEVKAPVDMTLDSYAHYKVSYAPGANWVLIFRINNALTLKLDHLTRVSDRIKAATATTPQNSSAEDRPRTSVTVKAGEVIAYTSGTKPANNWNIYLYDTGVTNTFVNQKRFTSDQIGQRLINASCVFQYYPDNLKSSYFKLMGYSKAGQLSHCGNVSHDVAGSASGMWFLSQTGLREEQSGVYASPLSIIKNSAGEVTIDQINGRRLDIGRGNASWKDPGQIKGNHCYALRGNNNQAAGYMYVAVQNPTTMKVAHSSSGSCPSTLPLSAKTYYR